MDKLNPATLELLVWTFGTLLFFVLTTATGFLIKLLSKLSEKSAQHEVRLERVEGAILILFTIPYSTHKSVRNESCRHSK